MLLYFRSVLNQTAQLRLRIVGDLGKGAVPALSGGISVWSSHLPFTYR